MRFALLFLLAVFSLVPLPSTTAPRSTPASPTPSAKRHATARSAKDIVFERDQNLMIERYTRKLGNQFVSSILRGNGAVVLDGAPSAELSFICLLADDKQRGVLRLAAARQRLGAGAMHARRPLRGKPRACLELLLQRRRAAT